VVALIHDVGLLGLPDAVVRRAPSELPPGGRVQYQQHPVLGQRLLSSVAQLAQMALWIRHHHERWDGKGYPDGLAGLATPLPARLIALADGYLQALEQEGGTALRWRQAQPASGAYDPNLLPVLEDEVVGRPLPLRSANQRRYSISDLAPGMVLSEPIRTAAGAILLQTAEVLTVEHIARLQNLVGRGVLTMDSVAIETSRDDLPA
jgi:hypothetical protein